MVEDFDRQTDRQANELDKSTIPSYKKCSKKSSHKFIYDDFVPVPKHINKHKLSPIYADQIIPSTHLKFFNLFFQK